MLSCDVSVMMEKGWRTDWEEKTGEHWGSTACTSCTTCTSCLVLLVHLVPLVHLVSLAHLVCHIVQGESCRVYGYHRGGGGALHHQSVLLVLMCICEEVGENGGVHQQPGALPCYCVCVWGGVWGPLMKIHGVSRLLALQLQCT